MKLMVVICFMLLAISMIVFGANRLTDNTCGIDKASLENAPESYRALQKSAS